MNNPKISVIIPVYNSEKHLQKCINSIINQTFINFEAIFINDGSADSSLEILKSNKSLDSRIKIINQENCGTGEARNNGLKNALGEYILFVDADDTIESNMIEKMYLSFTTSSSDMVICGITRILPNGEKIKDSSYKDINENNIFPLILSFTIMSSVWNKLYKKEIFTKNNLFFPKNLKHNEDNAIMFQLIYFAKKISFVREDLYNWYYVENSKSNSISTERLDSINHVLNIRYNFLIEYNIYNKYEIDFVKSMLILLNLRINNIINFNNKLLKYFENLVEHLPYFTKGNLQIAKHYLPQIYFNFINTIIKLNENSSLLSYFDYDDILNIKKYLGNPLGLLQSIIDNLDFYNPKDIYVYGTGENFIKLKQYLCKYNIKGVLDKNPNYDNLINYNIVKLEDILLNDNITIVITSIEFAFEIKSYIEDFIFENHKNNVKIIYCFDFINLGSVRNFVSIR
ncbi:glycosyltransferase [Aliarcobacter cryaerophilus]|uniref:glycosyltransferase family 2 protein n=1 Tax=Aliarcobacter cryaerophilus TaxID=28198 RepID=UPI003DA6AFBF